MKINISERDNVNRNHKDRLFAWIFGKEENKRFLLSLYNAINGTDYQDEDIIEINTMEDVIYMSMKNDVSFILGYELSLYEHQSTYSRNMPFRQFEYCAKLYNGIVAARNDNIYSSKLIKFPTPHCYVFYNGEGEHEDREILHLSDAFETPSEGYEWTTIMLNINYGHNRELMEKCKVIQEYALFVQKIRENKSSMDIQQAIDEAVDYIIKLNGELSSFFSGYKGEVFDMCLTEYNEEEHLKSEKKESFGEGFEQGRKEEIFQSVYEKDFSIDRAAEKLKISVSEATAQYEEWCTEKQKQENKSEE